MKTLMESFSLVKKKFVTPLKVLERYTNVFILIVHPSSDENAIGMFSLVKKKVRNPSKNTRKIYERLYSDCSSNSGWKCNRIIL